MLDQGYNDAVHESTLGPLEGHTITLYDYEKMRPKKDNKHATKNGQIDLPHLQKTDSL